MNKVLVQIYIPVTGKGYDVMLPKTLSVASATRLVAEFFDGALGGAYLPDENTMLCSMEDGRIYSVNDSVESLHLRNGSRLMLI